MKKKSAVILTVFDADKMSPSGVKDIAKWLRMQARYLEKYHKEYASRFTGRYFYTE